VASTKSTAKDRLRAPTCWLNIDLVNGERGIVVTNKFSKCDFDGKMVRTELLLPINFQNAVLMERRLEVSEGPAAGPITENPTPSGLLPTSGQSG